MKNLHLRAISAIALAAILVGCVTPQYTYKPAKPKSGKHASSSGKSSAMVATPVNPELKSQKFFEWSAELILISPLLLMAPVVCATAQLQPAGKTTKAKCLETGLSFLAIPLAIPVFVAGVAALVSATGCSVDELTTGQRYIPILQKTPPPILSKSSEPLDNESMSLLTIAGLGIAGAAITIPTTVVVVLPVYVAYSALKMGYNGLAGALGSVAPGSDNAPEKAATPTAKPNTSSAKHKHPELSPKHRPYVVNNKT